MSPAFCLQIDAASPYTLDCMQVHWAWLRPAYCGDITVGEIILIPPGEVFG